MHFIFNSKWSQWKFRATVYLITTNLLPRQRHWMREISLMLQFIQKCIRTGVRVRARNSEIWNRLELLKLKIVTHIAQLHASRLLDTEFFPMKIKCMCLTMIQRSSLAPRPAPGARKKRNPMKVYNTFLPQGPETLPTIIRPKVRKHGSLCHFPAAFPHGVGKSDVHIWRVLTNSH